MQIVEQERALMTNTIHTLLPVNMAEMVGPPHTFRKVCMHTCVRACVHACIHKTHMRVHACIHKTHMRVHAGTV